MAAIVHYDFDLRDFRRLKHETMRLMARGTVRAVRQGLEEGADYARRNHIHKRVTGRLTSEEELRGVLRQQDDRGAWGYLQNTTPYARFVEEATRPHLILPLDYSTSPPTSRVSGRRTRVAFGVGRGKMLRFYVGGSIVFRRSVRHPGTLAMPFMEPASVFAGEVIRRETENVTFVIASALWE